MEDKINRFLKSFNGEYNKMMSTQKYTISKKENVFCVEVYVEINNSPLTIKTLIGGDFMRKFQDYQHKSFIPHIIGELKRKYKKFDHIEQQTLFSCLEFGIERCNYLDVIKTAKNIQMNSPQIIGITLSNEFKVDLESIKRVSKPPEKPIKTKPPTPTKKRTTVTPKKDTTLNKKIKMSDK